MKNLPLGLRHVLESGDCVLFLGAGVGGHLKRADGVCAPDRATLAREICARFKIVPESEDLAKVAQLVDIRNLRPDLVGFLKKRLSGLEPDDSLKWLTSFRWRAIFTTNYDSGLLRAYELNSTAPQIPVPMSLTSDLQYVHPATQVPIFYLHGALFGSVESSIVITQDDYAKYQSKRRMLWERLKLEFATSSLLYIGYSGKDPNWRLVLDELTQEFHPSSLPQSYRTDPCAEIQDMEILEHKQITTIETDLAGFQVLVKSELGDFKPDPDLLGKFRKDVPNDLLASFESNPASVLRLLSSWEYVNAADFHKQPNVQPFLKGDRANWAVVGAEIPFKRDVEDEVWEEVLEFSTQPKAAARALAVIAPAGYGVTTLLMMLAVRVVKERIGPVFMLRPGADVLEADVDFAASIYPTQSVFFIVDQARERAAAASTSLTQQAHAKSRCIFILGERKNEWRMARFKAPAQEFEIQPLSDSEIDRLLDLLTKQGALGKLTGLDRDFQFAVVKERHEKQLLVAMREAIEGSHFDAIIEDEFRGISDHAVPGENLPADFYLLTAGFYLHGVMLRDQLAARILNISLPELYEEIKESLEGIVLFEESDAARGEYAARARHRIIAEVVWKRCGDPSMKEHFLQSAMDNLNLAYRLDKAVFEKFVRSDEIVESFRTLEGKTRFFETACKREPENPYVLQHFSRMLLRAGAPTTALTQIDRALKMNDSLRVLHHTRGNVLAELALKAESEEIARKWMLQSENEFRQCISMNEKDHYGHVGLAQLYLDWAKRVRSEDESSNYVTRCEEIISNGLRVVRERESLWIVSAGVQRYLGDNPGQIQKLIKAVSESTSSAIPRYLLGRAYRDAGQPEKCIEVLDPIIKTKFSEFRAFVEYTRALLELHAPYSKCIGILVQSRLDGLADPAFVGLLGGLLFMEQKFSDSAKIFAECTKQGFTFEERTKTQFRPIDVSTGRPVRLDGKVVSVQPGYVFIQSSPYPNFISTMTRIGKTILQKNVEVTFEPTFGARGQFADRVALK